MPTIFQTPKSRGIQYVPDAQGKNRACHMIESGANAACVATDLSVLIDRNRAETHEFTVVERNPPLDASLFQFQPEAGVREIGAILWLAALPPSSNPQKPVSQVSNQLPPPTLTKIVRPVNPGEGTRLRQVALYVELDAMGIPEHVSVVASLGPTLDESAIECIRQWRFEPIGVPIGTAITVNFRIP